LLQLDRGYTEEARKYLEEALGQAEQIGHSFHIAMCNHHLSVLFCALGECSAALEYGLRSETLFKNLGEKSNLVDVYVNLGVVYLEQGDLEQATHCGEKALALLAEFSTDNDETEVKGSALRLLGDAALAARELESAQKLYRQAEQIFEAVGNRLERGRLLISLARLSWLQSNRMLSKSCLMLAQKLFEQLGARLDLQKLEVLKKSLGPGCQE
jgi:tetratricopeptide (TPR) repeat protein